jgi:sugar phosphate permease
MVVAIMAANGAACMLYSRYCPSLYDTGLVSTATGFLDFISYIAAALSSSLFANMVTKIGWGNLILIWFGLMVFGIIISIPYKKKSVNRFSKNSWQFSVDSFPEKHFTALRFGYLLLS